VVEIEAGAGAVSSGSGGGLHRGGDLRGGSVPMPPPAESEAKLEETIFSVETFPAEQRRTQQSVSIGAVVGFVIVFTVVNIVGFPEAEVSGGALLAAVASNGGRWCKLWAALQGFRHA